ncbi:MAG TPA: CorA family divalent cation transporter [Pirellulaceae bacterium]|nr:CorA family divalent cation transporter [Pirellulaceae bacterium]
MKQSAARQPVACRESGTVHNLFQALWETTQLMVTKSLLPPAWDLPPLFRQRLGDSVGKQRLMQEGGHLLLVLHRVPKVDENQRVGRYFWRKPDGTWLGMEPGGRSVTLANHLSEFHDATEKLDRFEDQASTAQEYFAVISALGPLLRTVKNLHRVLQDAREAASDDRELINQRDRAYELERSAELLYTNAKNGLDFAVARQAEQQAAASHRMAVSAHRLNLLAAFFFPLATIAAVLGVNIKHGWEEIPPPLPFFIMLGAGLLSGLLLMLYVSLSRRT